MVSRIGLGLRNLKRRQWEPGIGNLKNVIAKNWKIRPWCVYSHHIAAIYPPQTLKPTVGVACGGVPIEVPFLDKKALQAGCDR